MASSGQYTGENVYVKFGTTELSGNYTKISWSEEVDLKDVTAGTDTNRKKLARVKDGSASMTAYHPSGTAGTALWGAIAVGGTGTLEWGPEGTAAGKPKHTVAAFVKSRKKNAGAEDAVEFVVDFDFNGAVTDGVYS
jgi:hypothetical protein